MSIGRSSSKEHEVCLLSGSLVDAADMMTVVRNRHRRSSLVFLHSRPGGSGDVKVRVDHADEHARGRQYQHNDELDGQQQCHATRVVAGVGRHVALQVTVQVR